LSLEQLDAFLVHARTDPQLKDRLQRPVDIADLLVMAADAGFFVEESDVIAAQCREDDRLTAEELQRRAGNEARRLRSFVPG
jgi:predicted ribosomally synthesized peptide with nif11-like leader